MEAGLRAKAWYSGLIPPANYAVLHMFGDGTYARDGNDPFVAGLTLDSSGHLYGTTAVGGSAGGGDRVQA